MTRRQYYIWIQKNRLRIGVLLGAILIFATNFFMKTSKTSTVSKFKINISRFIIFILGIYILYWGLFYNGTDSIWSYLGITGAIYFTGAITVLILGLYWEAASSTGAVLALVGGLSALVGLEPIRNALSITYMPEQIGIITLCFTFLLMFLGSILFPDKGAS